MMQQTKPDDPDAVDPDAIATQGVGVFFSRAVYSLSLSPKMLEAFRRVTLWEVLCSSPM